MRIWTSLISFALLMLFCWQLAVLFLSPFWLGQQELRTNASTTKQSKRSFTASDHSNDIVDWDSTSSLFEEVLEEEIDITSSVNIPPTITAFISFAEALILPCKNFSQAYLDPPEKTV